MKKVKGNDSQPISNESKEPKAKKSGGFLSGLFGTGKKESSKPEKKQPPRKGNPKSNLKKQVKEDRPAEVVNKPPQKAKPDYTVNRPYMSKSTSEELYGKKEMEQNIFLFAPPEAFLPIQKYINESFEGITAVGTSSVADVVAEYRKKVNSKHILVFTDSNQTTNELMSLLALVAQVKATNPELISIYVVFGKGADIEVLRQKDFANMINIYRTPSAITDVTESLMNKIMSKIVSNQPTYVDAEEPIPQPEKAKPKNILSVDKPFEVQNIVELREKVKQARMQNTDDYYDSLKSTILETKSTEQLDDIQNMIPELSVLKEYGEALNEYLESAGDNLSKEEINELVLSRLELTAVQEETVRQIFDSVINVAKNNAEDEDKLVRANTRNDAAVLGDIKFTEDLEKDDEQIQEVFQLREEVKSRALGGFEKYKEEIKAISNAIEIRKALMQETQKALVDTIKTNQNAVDQEIQIVAAKKLQEMDRKKLAIDKSKQAIQVQMQDTLSYVQTVFKDYNVLISIDDVLIEKLQADKKKLKAHNLKRVYEVDNLLTARGKMMVWSGVDKLKEFVKYTLQPTTLLITTINDLEYKDKVVTDDYRNYVNTDHSSKPNVVIIDRAIDELDDLNTLITKLKYTSKYYNKVLFLITDDDWEIMRPVLNQVPEVIFITSTDDDAVNKTNEMLSASREMENVYARTVLIPGYRPEIDVPKKELFVRLNLRPNDRKFLMKEAKDKESISNLIYTLRKL